MRDSFTIPKIEYKVLQDSKDRAAALGRPVKKSELLRAGLKALAGMSDAAFVSALAAVPALKTGVRPRPEIPERHAAGSQSQNGRTLANSRMVFWQEAAFGCVRALSQPTPNQAFGSFAVMPRYISRAISSSL